MTKTTRIVDQEGKVLLTVQDDLSQVKIGADFYLGQHVFTVKTVTASKLYETDDVSRTIVVKPKACPYCKGSGIVGSAVLIFIFFAMALFG